GALAGSIGITMFRPKIRGMFFVRMAFLTGIGLIAFSLSNSFVISGGIVMVIGVTQALRMTLSSALIQTYTERQYLGRVLSIQLTQGGLSTLAGTVVAVGAVAIGVQYAIMICSVLLMIVGGAYWVFSRRLNKLA